MDVLETYLSGNNPILEGEEYKWFGNLTKLNQTQQDIILKKGISMQLVLNTETINSTRSDNTVSFVYRQLDPYFNTTTRMIQYQMKRSTRLMLADGERNKWCRALAYTV